MMLEGFVLATTLQAAEPRAPQACDLSYQRALTLADDGVEGVLHLHTVGERCLDAAVILESYDANGNRILFEVYTAASFFDPQAMAREDVAQQIAHRVETSREVENRSSGVYAISFASEDEVGVCMEGMQLSDYMYARMIDIPVIEFATAPDIVRVFWWDDTSSRLRQLGFHCNVKSRDYLQQLIEVYGRESP